MKARHLTGLDPAGPLQDNVRLILGERIDELISFIPAALDETQVTALHDMRIAAKRLRYLLDVVGFCCGEDAQRIREHARALHGLIGEIHDCDVLLPRLRELDGEGGALLVARYEGLRHERFEAFLAYWHERPFDTLVAR